MEPLPAQAPVAIGQQARDVVVGIGNTFGQATLTYTASATAAVAPGSDARTVIFTITGEE